MSVIRVFVGCAPDGMDAESCAVLEWSIRKHASRPVEIEFMALSRDPKSFWYNDANKGWQIKEWATPFSGFRWAIAEHCGFEGRAIYTDSDVIYMADIAQLHDQEIPDGQVALAKGSGSWRYCVSVWNCAEAKKHIWPVERLRRDPNSHRAMSSYFANHAGLTKAFVGDWNCLDGQNHRNLKDGVMKALHYTDMSSQPQLTYALPRLAAQGRKHWFDGKVRRHPRDDVISLFNELFNETKEQGLLEKFLDTPKFGNIQKRALPDYRGTAK